MAGVLGLGSSGSTSLNEALIEKLKEADKASSVTPLEKKLEKFTTEKEVVANIQTKVNELLSAVKVFSLNQTTGANAFQQKSANVTGDGVVFDSDDLSALKSGSLSVKVEQLAQKDVWQSKQFDKDEDDKSITKDSLVNQGTLKINGTPIDTTNKSYSDLVSEINKIDGVQASIVEDSTGKFRISIKSTETGEANKINFSGSDSTALSHFGFDDTANNVLKAQDMKMKVDGVDYSGSSNTITIDGLKITATKSTGESTINIEDDNSNIKTQMQAFVTAYNTLNTLISGEVYSTDSSLGDKASIRNVMSQLKEQLFGTGSGDKTIFSYGFSFDSSNGNLVLSSTEFENAIKNDKEGLQNLFVGVAEKKGIATALDELISNSGINKDLIDYESNMLSRQTKLTEQKDKAQEALDTKYKLMSQQFAAYTTIITQMENSFSGLKMLIQQSTASK
ncbi:flagellar filament capping protein FliD [Aliarcobacter butzleri]|uniref:Flagellar hook-associated protein 2 n=1 Tax=Aliarcobacter butzleri L352 TaxID=1447260 RepID=A0A837JB10_9BACT|nr:flagellar filament capping protein FliD [Aliarcobacter butzleri]KLE03805.1 flagellar hook protein FliD [Aliarcobacter butzleri L352]KLE08821.1 flagellar hook protein FliD [Aliarcobacter butzleri L354]MCG3654492.1 flagellar filament capping protein FliD [Aliarcobacter butzleri]MCG3694096.1 flagellar filament capping protein FliD [Aliarcobacter butzleri]MDN5073888.1 flagellar filament capping protein FliD [Aliarcobacter butzleri]